MAGCTLARPEEMNRPFLPLRGDVAVTSAFKTSSLGFASHVVDLYQRCGQVTDPHATPYRERRVILTTAEEDYVRS